MTNHIIPDLQLFADGGDGGAGTAGETPAAAAQDTQARLLELGVPADKLRRRATKADTPIPEGAFRQETRPDAAAQNPPKRMSWEEIMADPDYNRQMQGVVQERLKKSRGAEETLGKLDSVISRLARSYGLDPSNVDYEALAQAVERNAGTEEGSPRTNQQPPRPNGQFSNLDQQQAQAPADRTRLHLDGLQRQGETLKKTFPGFDLRRELQNPTFARMTSPAVGLSVEDAFYAVHRSEIQNAAMQVTAQRAAEKLTNSLQANSLRPREAGAQAQSPTALSFDYRKASPTQREAIKKRIRDAAARGEKVYPGSR